MMFAFVDFALGLLNLALYEAHGNFVNAFTAGFCFGMGIAILLDKIFDRWDD